MLDDEDPQQDDNLPSFPDSSRRNKAARGVLNAASATPFIGGIENVSAKVSHGSGGIVLLRAE